MEELLDLLLKNLVPLIFLFMMIGPGLSSLLGKTGNNQRPSGPPPSSGTPPVVSDLEERVRRNFEELMRKRRKGSTPDPLESPRPVAEFPELREPDPTPPPEPPTAPPPPPVSHPATPAAHRHSPPFPARASQKASASPTPPSPAGAYNIDSTNAYQIETDQAYELEGDAYRVDVNAYKLGSDQGTLRSARDLFRETPLNRRTMRRAILMKEILDKPTALREPGEYW